MVSNSGRPIVDCDEVWKEVGQVNFGRTSPTNEHDRHSVRGIVALMMETRDAINNGGCIRTRPASLRTS